MQFKASQRGHQTVKKIAFVNHMNRLLGNHTFTQTRKNVIRTTDRLLNAAFNLASPVAIPVAVVELE